jgi:hypothetical protein
MQRRSARFLHIAALMALVAGCAGPPPRPTYPDIHFTNRPPLELDVARVDVQMDYRMPMRAPNVEHLFPVPPSRAMENWAHDRLKPTGNSGRAIFIIRNASVTETDLPQTEGVRGAFTTEPAQRYDMALEANLVIEVNGLQVKTASVRVSRSDGVLNDATPNDRDRTEYDMTRAAMGDFDKQMETEIRNNFGTFLVR